MPRPGFLFETEYKDMPDSFLQKAHGVRVFVSNVLKRSICVDRYKKESGSLVS